MIFFAMPAPTPSSFMSAVWSASLMLTLPSVCACAFAGGCGGLSSAPHAVAPVSHHALTTIAMSHRVVLIRASLEECGTADAHSTPRGRGLTMPRIPDTLVPGGASAAPAQGWLGSPSAAPHTAPGAPPPLVRKGAPLLFGPHRLCVSIRGRGG